MSRLNEHYNSLTPIGKLPPETLGRIFEFIVSPDRNLYNFHPDHSKKTLPLLSVCKAWRITALNWPRMWYHIIDADLIPREICGCNPETIFARSGATPLHVYAYIWPMSKQRSPFLRIYRDHPNRIQEAHIQIDIHYSLGEVLQLLSTPMPNLNCFNLTATRPYQEHERNTGMPMILGGDSARLKALVLKAAFIPGNAFPNLVNLRLHSISGHGLPIWQLLQLFRNCLRLETLDLSHTALSRLTAEEESGAGAKKPDMSPVVLAHLHGLRMGYMSVDHVLAILAFLHLPKHPVMRLDSLYGSPPPYTGGSLNIAESFWSSLMNPHISSMYNVKGLAQVDVMYLTDDHGYAHIHIVSHGQDQDRCGIWFHCGRGNMEDFTTPLERLLAHVDTRDVTTLRLRVSVDVPAVTWIVFLSHMLERVPSLARLSVEEEPARRVPSLDHDWVIRALLPPLTDTSDTNDHTVPAPQLDTLEIWQTERGEEVRTGTMCAAVQSMVAIRKERGHPLRSLACNIPDATQDDLAALSEYVEELRVTNERESQPGCQDSFEVPSAFRMKNDYWHMFRYDKNLERWKLPC